MKIVLLSISLFMMMHFPILGQSVPVLKFDALEPRLHQNDGNTWIINFWATWCAPCVKEIPHFEKIADEYQHLAVKVLFVSLDFAKQLETRVIPFIIEKEMRSEVVLLNDPNANNWIDKVSPDWSGSLPATLIYNGKQRYFYEQTFTYQELKEVLDKVFNDK